MPDLRQLKAHLKLDLADTSEDALLTAYLAAAKAAFKAESKRRWPVQGEPVLSVVTDPTTVPPTTVTLGYVDSAVLSSEEQELAEQWQRLAVGHWYENRQEAVADSRAAVAQLPMACGYLMDLVRTPTL